MIQFVSIPCFFPTFHSQIHSFPIFSHPFPVDFPPGGPRGLPPWHEAKLRGQRAARRLKQNPGEAQAATVGNGQKNPL